MATAYEAIRISRVTTMAANMVCSGPSKLFKKALKVSRQKQMFLLVGVVVTFCVMTTVQRVTKQLCSYSDTVRVVNDLCTLYNHNHFNGTMCSRLCEQNVFTYDSCGQDAYSDKFVLMMGCQGCNLGQQVSKMVMKGSFKAEELARITENVFVESNPLEDIILQTEDLVTKQVIAHLGESSPKNKDMLSKMFGADFKAWSIGKTRDDVMSMLRTLLSLSMQEEYAKLAFLGSVSYLPKVYGFCGPAFFVENTPSVYQTGHIIEYKSVKTRIEYMYTSFKSWSQRAAAALDLLSTIRALESPEGPILHICDLEIRNTGISDSGSVVFLDIDKVRYDMIFAGKNCSSDFCCGREMCEGKCDTVNGVCTRERVNDNLQAACRKLFVGHYKGVYGLLRFPPDSIKDELKKVLDQCVHPEKYPSRSKSRPRAASLDTLNALERLLTLSLEGGVRPNVFPKSGLPNR